MRAMLYIAVLPLAGIAEVLVKALVPRSGSTWREDRNAPSASDDAATFSKLPMLALLLSLPCVPPFKTLPDPALCQVCIVAAAPVRKSGAVLSLVQLRVASGYGNIQLCGNFLCGCACLPQSFYLLPFIKRAKNVTGHSSSSPKHKNKSGKTLVSCPNLY